MEEIRLVSPGSNGNVINEYGIPERPPSGWAFLPAGDAALTRKVTAQGTYWRVQIKKGKRIHSKGIWAPKTNIGTAKRQVEDMRSSPGYEKKRKSALKSRDKKQAAYMIKFEQAVNHYLNFHFKHIELQTTMARLVTAHAIPVGSGTVARTTMIPIEERAAKAVIAWMRHQTTDYDKMKIARIKGERRSVRRKLASISVHLLNPYRDGSPIPPDCPLSRALKGKSKL